MGQLRLAWKNILHSAFRSLAVFLSAALVAGVALWATFLVRGAENSLRSNLEHLGADILVLPWGTLTERIEGIRLMSAAIDGWMPTAYMDQIAAMDGVAQVSPQIFITSLEDSPYSPYPQMYVVAYDPATDFTLQPWSQDGASANVKAGEAIAGAHISLPEGGSELNLYGSRLQLVDRLEPTQTSIDNTLFVSLETAEQMRQWAAQTGDATIKMVPGGVSAVLVRLELDSDPHEVSLRIMEEVRSVTPLETPNLFQSERQQMIGLLRTLLFLLTGIWGLAVVFMGLVFSIAVNERRFEIGVLRALGYSSNWILRTLLMEGATLALAGGFTGVLAAVLSYGSLNELVMNLTRLPLFFPTPIGLMSLALGGQALSLLSVTLAAFLPAWRISREEVAFTMRD